MNAGPDVERLLSDWLVEEAPAGAPDRMVLAATDRIDHTMQRRFGAARRHLPMNPPVRVAAAAVLGVLLLGGAYFLGGGGGPDIGAPATPRPSPTASAIMDLPWTPERAAQDWPGPLREEPPWGRSRCLRRTPGSARWRRSRPTRSTGRLVSRSARAC